MKLKFKHQSYQDDAVQSLVKCFLGQKKGSRRDLLARYKHTVDTGMFAHEEEVEVISFGNNSITLTESERVHNIREVQRLNDINYTDGQPLDEFSVEMETGTGKTFTYIKSMYEFNKEYGTKYTTDQILQEHIDDYLKWWAARVQLDSNKLTYRTEKYHYGLPKQVDGNTLNLLRHTPKDKQKFIYYNPMLIMAKARVLPEIFNPQYITEQNGEGVDYWQSFDDPQAIRVKPSIPVGESKEIVIPKLVGMLFDEDALITHYDLDSVYTTPIEARKCLYNTWYHYAQSTFDDFTENGIIYYMADDAAVSP